MRKMALFGAVHPLFPAPQSARGHFKVPAQIFNSSAMIAAVCSLLELQYFDFRSNIINYTRLCTTVVSGSCLILLFHFCRTALQSLFKSQILSWNPDARYQQMFFE